MASSRMVRTAGRRRRKRQHSTSPTAHIFSAKAGARPASSLIQFAALPSLVFAVVVLLPFLVGVILSFTNWTGIDPVTSFKYEFTGLKNYTDALGDAGYRATLAHTAWYIVSVVVLGNLAGFGLALLVTSKLRAKGFFRTLFFTPNVIGGVILGFIWVFVFNQMLPWLGAKMGIGLFEFSWLVEPTKALMALVIVTVWQLSGYLMLIYIAGLVSIPSDVVEVALVDGASAWQQLRFVKIPLMMPAFTISIFLSLQRAFLMFDTNLALTDGGPFRSTELVTLNVYFEAFRYQRFETAQAKAVLLYVVVAIVAAVQVRALRRYEVTE